MDWLLSILVITGNYMLGKKMIFGWVVMLVNSIGWIIYAFTFDDIQYGLVPAAAINVFLSVKGYLEWRKPVDMTVKSEGYWEKLCRVYVQQISDKDARIAEYEDKIADQYGEIEELETQVNIHSEVHHDS